MTQHNLWHLARLQIVKLVEENLTTRQAGTISQTAVSEISKVLLLVLRIYGETLVSQFVSFFLQQGSILSVVFVLLDQ